MTITESTTDLVEVVPARPAFSVPKHVLELSVRALELIEAVEGQLEHIDSIVSEIREAFHDVVLEMAPYHPGVEADWTDVPAAAIGWSPVWERLIRLGGRYDPMRFHHLDLEADELARGERNIPVGRRVTLNDRDGVPTDMEVALVPGPRAEQLGHYTVRQVEEPHRTFLASHDEVKAGAERAGS